MTTGIQPGFVTIAEAARLFGVTLQRMHQLISDYDVKKEKIHARLYLVAKSELAKIPEDRPTGIHRDK